MLYPIGCKLREVTSYSSWWKTFWRSFIKLFLTTITDLIYCAFSLRKHPTFHDATSGFPSKWCLRNVSGEIPYRGCVDTTLIRALVTHHQLKICFIQSGKWHLINVEFLCSFLRHHFCRESAGDITKCWLFSQAIVPNGRGTKLLKFILRNCEWLWRTWQNNWVFSPGEEILQNATWLKELIISGQSRFRLLQSRSMSWSFVFSLTWVNHKARLRQLEWLTKFDPVLLIKRGQLLKSLNSVVLRKKSWTWNERRNYQNQEPITPVEIVVLAAMVKPKFWPFSHLGRDWLTDW